VAASVAATGAAQALIRGDAGFEVAAAKLRANMAIGDGSGIAHQVHGAIGFTEEYGLHPLTRRLWSWRSEFGGDALWSSRLGLWATTKGADHFWPSIADRTDPLEFA
jgi:acyl-CoA dehydrogenase